MRATRNRRSRWNGVIQRDGDTAANIGEEYRAERERGNESSLAGELPRESDDSVMEGIIEGNWRPDREFARDKESRRSSSFDRFSRKNAIATRFAIVSVSRTFAPSEYDKWGEGGGNNAGTVLTRGCERRRREEGREGGEGG